MDGILIIDKPEGLTSHDVVARLRRILKTKKVGHTGTLDPFATGVLVMLVGKATRLAQFLDKDEKEYEAVVRFGFETDTGDRTGSRIADRGLRIEEIFEKLDGIEWESVFNDFRGEILQTPPMYSAKKVDGKKLYEHARKGVEIERKPVKINVRELELFDCEQIRDPRSAIRIRVVCSAGTYIRTLAEDIGRTISLGAHLQELRRIRAGKFDISQAISLDELEAEAEPSMRLLPMSGAVSHLPEFTLSAERAEKTLNGLSTRIDSGIFKDGDTVRMTNEKGELIAIGIFDEEECRIHPKIVLA